ncbi:MAG TPA: lysozyme inhibitor LprI family protein, partial [Desulfomonilaceae bacterium]|nr:lysozyme inhibitor LprI family protein [Desulfomonilaceae bacterium]
MKIHNLILAIFFLLMTAGNAHAASFDCGKATSEVEKIICSNDELSRLDESLNKAYQKALTRTETRKQTIESQKQWLQNERDACENAECIKNAYETRIWELSPSSHDDYRWTGDLNPEGDWQYIPVDPEICKLYEKNLRYFAKRNTPMSCNRPIAPHLKDRIKEVEWEDLDPDKYPDLLRAIATFNDYLLDPGEDKIQRHLTYVRADIANKVRVFRRAKLSLVGRTQVQAY